MSFVLIEHDLDIALRVVERVTVMHNGRVLKTGTPDEIENDAQVQAIYMGASTDALWSRDRDGDGQAQRPGAGRRGPRRLLRPRACAAGRGLHARARRVRASSGATAWARPRCATPSPASCKAHAAASRLGGEEILGLPPQRRSPAAASPMCRRGGASGRRCRWTRRCAWCARRKREVERVYAMFPRLAERKGHGGAHAVGRRAADAGDRPCAAARAAPAGDGRAHRGLAPAIVEQVRRRCASLAATARSRCC